MSSSVDIHPLHAVSIRDVKVKDAFWSPKLKVWRETTLGDVLDKFENEGAFANFDRVAKKLEGEHNGQPWYDGLIYETLRGAADFLMAKRNQKLEMRIDMLIDRIAMAADRDPNGYLNTYTQLMRPTQRWGLNGGDAIWQHDLYNAGAMVEAGVHYAEATGKVKLLKIATRFANHICDLMGKAPKQNIIPEHALPEEAFIELYRLYRDQPELKKQVGLPIEEKRYLELVEFWVEARGHYEGRKSFGPYSQDHMPILDQPTIEGHAVRATLLFAGMTAAAYENRRGDYCQSLDRIWTDMVYRKMHITGGVGAYAAEEKFGADYELPNDAYLETCAAVSAGFFHRNMNLLFGNARSVDELERTLYNGVLAGISLSGDHYFYVNPLEAGESHVRWAWHSCPCCPPMFLKIMAALPGYIFAHDQDTLYVNLFVGSEAKVQLSGNVVEVQQTTRYPWQGRVQVHVNPTKEGEFGVAVRIPSDAGDWTLSVNGDRIAYQLERGYAIVRRVWKRGDVVELNLPLKPKLVQCNPKAVANRGLNAIMRGPIVYCLESVDNHGHVRDIVIPPNAKLSARYEKDLFGGVVKVIASGMSIREEDWKTDLYRTHAKNMASIPTPIIAIPYYANANRLPGDMRVWIPETPDRAEPRPLPTIASEAMPSASYHFERDPLSALNDRIDPKSSHDATISRFTWWPHKGTTEWVQYDFDKVTEIEGVEVYWWDETETGANCRVPASWKLFYREKGEWKPINNALYGVDVDRFNRTTFKSIKTNGLRIEVQMKPEHSAGILEWRVLG